MAPLCCDLGFVPNSRGNKAAAHLRPNHVLLIMSAGRAGPDPVAGGPEGTHMRLGRSGESRRVGGCSESDCRQLEGVLDRGREVPGGGEGTRRYAIKAWC